MGHALLFAVGAGPLHDGVRRAWRPNLFHGVGGMSRRGRDSQRDRNAPRPHGNDLGRAVGREGQGLVQASFSVRVQAAGAGPKRKSASSRHMRCITTASLRATAIFAFFRLLRLAILKPQARIEVHWRERVSMT